MRRHTTRHDLWLHKFHESKVRQRRELVLKRAGHQSDTNALPSLVWPCYPSSAPPENLVYSRQRHCLLLEPVSEGLPFRCSTVWEGEGGSPGGPRNSKGVRVHKGICTQQTQLTNFTSRAPPPNSSKPPPNFCKCCEFHFPHNEMYEFVSRPPSRIFLKQF